MSTFLRIDINIAAMILLGVVFLIAYMSLDRNDTLNRVFLRISLIIILELFFETTTCVINKRPEQWMIPISVLFHVCLFTTAPILTYFWYSLINALILSKDTKYVKTNIIMLIPLVINFILTVLSPVFSFVFFVDSSNVYRRGSMFIISAAITYFYMVLSLLIIIKNRRKIVKQEFVPLFIFGILPMAGGLIQTLFYGTLLMWSSTAFSLVIVYIYLQQRMVHLDSLTGTWTRGSFDYHISQRIKQKNFEKFGIIYVDIDGLKEINDRLGHAEGDYAIKTSIELIKSVMEKNDIIARIGGDEFVIVVDCDSNEMLDRKIEKMNFRFLQYNDNSDKSYRLGCSFGADIFDSRYNSIEQFLHHVDNLMYSNKNIKKGLHSQYQKKNNAEYFGESAVSTDND